MKKARVSQTILLKLTFVFVFALMVLFAFPALDASAATTQINMMVGETKYLYPSRDDYDFDDRIVTSGSWELRYNEFVDLVSDSGQYFSAQIKAKKATGNSPVILRLNYSYLVAIGTYTYTMMGYVDYKIYITGSGSSSSDSYVSSTCTNGYKNHWWSDEMVYASREDAATCTEDGLAYRLCRRCKVKKYEVIEAYGHKMKVINGKAATVDEEGTIQHWYCSNCYKRFLDENGKNIVSVNDTVIPKLNPPVSNKTDSKDTSAAGTTDKTDKTDTTDKTNTTNKTDTTENVSSVTNEKIYTVNGFRYILKKDNKGKKSAMLVGMKKSKNSLKSLKIKDTVKIKKKTYKVTAVADNAFKGCSKLKTVSGGNNITTLGVQCFAECKALRTVQLGSNVKTISSKAFYGCKKLSNLTIRSKKLKTVGKKVLSGVSKKAVIKVPAGKMKVYTKMIKSAGWKKTMKIKKL